MDITFFQKTLLSRLLLLSHIDHRLVGNNLNQSILHFGNTVLGCPKNRSHTIVKSIITALGAAFHTEMTVFLLFLPISIVTLCAFVRLSTLHRYVTTLETS